MRHYWTLEEYAVIDPDQVPKMLPKFAKSHPHKYSSLNKAVKELRSAKRELYIGRVVMACYLLVGLVLNIMIIVNGEAKSLWDVLVYVGLYAFYGSILWCGIDSYKDLINDAKANLENELNGRDPTLFKALYKMIIQ